MFRGVLPELPFPEPGVLTGCARKSLHGQGLRQRFHQCGQAWSPIWWAAWFIYESLGCRDKTIHIQTACIGRSPMIYYVSINVSSVSTRNPSNQQLPGQLFPAEKQLCFDKSLTLLPCPDCLCINHRCRLGIQRTSRRYYGKTALFIYLPFAAFLDIVP